MTNKVNKIQRYSKPYWLYKNDFKQKKIPLIPPLFCESKFVTIFLEKAELLN